MRSEFQRYVNQNYHIGGFGRKPETKVERMQSDVK